MFDKAWRRHRTARAEAANRRAMAELRSRAAIRAAEELVGSAWISYLTRCAVSDPVARQRVEWEQVAIAQASRSRAREAADDAQRLAAVRAQVEELTALTQPVASEPSESR